MWQDSQMRTMVLEYFIYKIWAMFGVNVGKYSSTIESWFASGIDLNISPKPPGPENPKQEMLGTRKRTPVGFTQ